MNYIEAMEKINNRLVFGIKPGLERIGKLLHLLGDPQDQLKYVHVAGTNGKGTCCALVSSVLQKAGYRTGRYTSPYVLDFRERFQIDGEMISKEELAQVMERVSAVSDEMEKDGETITEFEFITALAFEWFYRSHCDIVVLEVGLGGRFDATNIIKPPEAAVIMSIGYDHTAVLGDTLEKIAFEKAGIIKPGSSAVLYPLQQEGVTAVIRSICEERGVGLTIPETDTLSLESADLDGSRFAYDGLSLFTPFLGEHQLYNAVTAYRVLRLLGEKGYIISRQNIKDGFEAAYMPTRMEIYTKQPLILLDGGHNPDCGAALRRAAEQFLSDKRIVCIAGMVVDKDVQAYMAEIAPLCERVITVRPYQNERALSASALMDITKPYCKDVKAADSIPAAVCEALQALSEDGALVVCGSFFMMAEIRAGLDKYVKKIE